MSDEKIVRLVSNRGDHNEESVSAWLRAMADQVDSGELGDVTNALAIFNVSADSDQFCCKIRKVSMTCLEAIGMLRMMMHDMLHN